MHLVKVALFGILILGIAGTLAAQVVDPALVGEQKAKLEKDLAEYEAQIDQFRVLIDAKRTEAASFERDVAILNAEIKRAQFAIKARTITVNELGDTIGQKSEYVTELLKKIERENNNPKINELSDNYFPVNVKCRYNGIHRKL